MTNDLIDFLRARLDEDAQAAGEASPGPWHPSEESDEVLAVDGITVADGFALSGRQLRATTEHIARHDPARVLREVEAKRRVMGRHHNFQGWCAGCGNDLTHRIPDCPELRDLAAAYTEHPEFREEWRP